MTPGCPDPIDVATLFDYWFDGLPEADAERVELHLLECDPCGAVLRDLTALGDGVRLLARAGAFHVIVSPSFLEAASRQGLRVREYRVPPGGRVDCTVTAADDLVVSRLSGDFKGLTRIDLAVRVDDGPEERVEDLPVALLAPEVILAQAMPALRALKSATVRMRLLGRGGEGEREIGEYTFAHTPS
jgi:hypothetical protein